MAKISHLDNEIQYNTNYKPELLLLYQTTSQNVNSTKKKKSLYNCFPSDFSCSWMKLQPEPFLDHHEQRTLQLRCSSCMESCPSSLWWHTSFRQPSIERHGWVVDYKTSIMVQFPGKDTKETCHYLYTFMLESIWNSAVIAKCLLSQTIQIYRDGYNGIMLCFNHRLTYTLLTISLRYLAFGWNFWMHLKCPIWSSLNF